MQAAGVPFSEAIAVVREDPGRYRAELVGAWEAGGGKQHGGLLLAVAARAALAELSGGPSPLVVSASFVRAAVTGPAEVRTEVLGDTGHASVVRSVLQQDGHAVLETTVTSGRALVEAPTGETTLPPEPPAELLEPAAPKPADPPLASACDVRIDPTTTAYRRRERTEPIMRGWVRPKGEPADVLFALFAGDILPTGLFNFGLLGWAPTVQLTALVPVAPAPGWLRVATATRSIAGGWFDEDVTVVDAAGRLVCRARQLARAPRG